MSRRAALSAFQAEVCPADDRSSTSSPLICSQQLPAIKFCNSFLLITIQNAAGGGRGSSRNQQLTNRPKLSPLSGSLCFHALTHCPICNFFVFKTLQQWGGCVGGPLVVSLKCYFNSQLWCSLPRASRGTSTHRDSPVCLLRQTAYPEAGRIVPSLTFRIWLRRGVALRGLGRGSGGRRKCRRRRR